MPLCTGSARGKHSRYVVLFAQSLACGSCGGSFMSANLALPAARRAFSCQCEPRFPSVSLLRQH